MNDSMLSVAKSYLNVQQARGELAGAEDALRRTDELVARTEKLAKGIVAPVRSIEMLEEYPRDAWRSNEMGRPAESGDIPCRRIRTQNSSKKRQF
jgi:hypothetical protein